MRDVTMPDTFDEAIRVKERRQREIADAYRDLGEFTERIAEKWPHEYRDYLRQRRAP